MSRYGANRGLPGYDEFRTGLTFKSVRRMLFVGGEDRTRWRYCRRRAVLGFWHSLKLQLYEQMRDDLDGRRAT